jgi:dihydroorotate dehydrogenase (fumarate)
MSKPPIILAGKNIHSYIGTASGAEDMTPEQIVALSNLDFFSLKSTKLQPWSGNAEPRFIHLPYGTMQSMGLPNIGLQETLRMIHLIYKPGMAIKASIAGANLEENVILMCAFQRSPVSFIEINWSCPNKEGEKIVADDLSTMDYELSRLTNIGGIPVGIKLPLYGDFERIKRIAAILIRRKIRFVTLINGVLGIDIDIDTGRMKIKPNGGKGAIGGKYIHYFALLDVYYWSQALKGSGVDIIGVGGIDCWEDAYKFLLAGASAVEVGSRLVKDGVQAIKQMNYEFDQALMQRNITIEAVKGTVGQYES